MMRPFIANETMNQGWLEFMKTNPDLTQTLSWILENVDENRIAQFQNAHEYKG